MRANVIPTVHVNLSQPSKHTCPDTDEEWQEPPVLPLPAAQYILEDQAVHQRHYKKIRCGQHCIGQPVPRNQRHGWLGDVLLSAPSSKPTPCVSRCPRYQAQSSVRLMTTLRTP